jgi:hypothetical protein
MAAPWSTSVGCRSGHEGPLRVDLSRTIDVTGTAGIGASRPLRRIPAIVSFLNPQPALSLSRRKPLFMPHTGHCPELVGAFRSEKERPFTLNVAAIR